MILFRGYNDGQDRGRFVWPVNDGVFSLFDTGTGELMQRHYWTIKNPKGSFNITRNTEGTFSIIYIGEGGRFYGEAVIDPARWELIVLWDRTDDPWHLIESDPPEHTFIIDPSLPPSADRTLNLERVIFAPWLELTLRLTGSQLSRIISEVAILGRNKLIFDNS